MSNQPSYGSGNQRLLYQPKLHAGYSPQCSPRYSRRKRLNYLFCPSPHSLFGYYGLIAKLIEGHHVRVDGLSPFTALTTQLASRYDLQPSRQRRILAFCFRQGTKQLPALMTSELVENHVNIGSFWNLTFVPFVGWWYWANSLQHLKNWISLKARAGIA